MMNRTELNLEAAEMICGGKEVTIDEIKKECKDSKLALKLVGLVEKVGEFLSEMGFKNICTYEINK